MYFINGYVDVEPVVTRESCCVLLVGTAVGRSVYPAVSVPVGHDSH